MLRRRTFADRLFSSAVSTGGHRAAVLSHLLSQVVSKAHLPDACWSETLLRQPLRLLGLSLREAAEAVVWEGNTQFSELLVPGE